MKITLIFTGLERTIEKTHANIKEYLIDNINTFYIYLITWKNESVNKFLTYFPEATIFYIEPIDIDNKEFQEWKSDLNIHESWLGKYKTNENALFNYYRQIYLWKEASKKMECMSSDLFIRCRTDIIMKMIQPKLYYNIFQTFDIDNIFMPTEPRQGAFGDWNKGCPDYVMIGKKEVLQKALTIIDYIYKYKYNNNEIRQYNTIQPESTMYLFLNGENIKINYLNFIIEVIR
jgi:hypothetical protein